MDAVRLTYARVLSVMQDGEDVYFDVAVKTEGGEIRPGLIRNTGFVMGRGLVFGAWVGGDFIPFEGGGGGGTVDTVRAIVTQVDQVGDRIFEYRWVEAEGGALQTSWTEKPGGRTDVFYNTLEGTSGGILYGGINESNISEDFQRVPLAIGARVVLLKVDGVWYLSAQQAIDGVCP